MQPCKAAQYNPNNACIDGKCKWPNACLNTPVRPTAPTVEPVADEECMATVMEMATEEAAPEATEDTPETPETDEGMQVPEAEVVAPKRSRKSSK